MSATTDVSARAPVTVVIAARNEAANIPGCIDSVRWAGEIVVVEDGSSDDTVALAQDAGARVLHHPFTTIGAQRNVAIEGALHEWVFVLDADERATDEVRDELLRIVTANGPGDAYRLPRRNFFLGKEIRHGGWERDRPVRLFRRGLRYSDHKVHESVQVTGEVRTLANPVAHYPYQSLQQYFEKLVRYSAWWAEQNHAKGRRVGVHTLVIRPVGRFLTMYILRSGWRDGAHGVVVAALASASVLAKYARLWDLNRTNPHAHHR